MILVSFSSAGVAWFEDVKRYGTFRSQATENPPFRFLWDTRYRVKMQVIEVSGNSERYSKMYIDNPQLLRLVLKPNNFLFVLT